MSDTSLDTYLNDHLAGSVGALELLDHLVEIYQGQPLMNFFAALREEINADQSELQSLIRHLDFKESELRKAGAWVLEKFGRLKFQLGSDGGLGLLQALEGIALGISGKEALWRALAVAAERSPQLRVLDYNRLGGRAREQFQRVDARRLELASDVLLP